MHNYSTRHVNMNKENITAARIEGPTVRITRARAKGFAASEVLPPMAASMQQHQKTIRQRNSKRSASEENKSSINVPACLQHKKRAVLKDLTNTKSSNAAKPHKQATKGTGKKRENDAPAIFTDNPLAQVANITEEMSKWDNELQQIMLPVCLRDNVTNEQNKCIIEREVNVAEMILVTQASSMSSQQKSPSRKEAKSSEKPEASDTLQIADVDSNYKDPKMCSLYAPDIYNNLRITELDRRPSIYYMEMLQKDITPNMRGILIDWLVEVSEEYRLVPDTLFLTVNLIDRFLSQNQIEKQRLQLLGVACMLIASKYEEICAPSIEEFCFITDNTYTREEVLKMECQVLNFLGFQLSVPTTKKFVRRFIQAAQVSSKAPSLELEFLANYLAELTLVDYSFLKFLPSLIAASAVFLAGWTLNQSDRPWNPTLEYYTSYVTSDLKCTVLMLQELQLNTKGCSINAISEKYKQEKFKCVAALSSPEPVESAFKKFEDN